MWFVIKRFFSNLVHWILHIHQFIYLFLFISFYICILSTKSVVEIAQSAFTCSKLTIKTLEQRCEICSKLTIKTPKRRQWCRLGVFIVNFEHISHRCSCVSIVNFEHVIAGWVKAKLHKSLQICLLTSSIYSKLLSFLKKLMLLFSLQLNLFFTKPIIEFGRFCTSLRYLLYFYHFPVFQNCFDFLKLRSIFTLYNIWMIDKILRTLSNISKKKKKYVRIILPAFSVFVMYVYHVVRKHIK